MALRLVNLQHTREFISENDPDYNKDFTKAKEDGATVFHIRQLKSYELAHLNDRMASFQMEEVASEETKSRSKSKKKASNSTQTTKLAMHAVALEAVRIAVVDADNLLDHSGNEMEVNLVKGRVAGKSVKVLPDEIMDAFDPDVALEIYQFIEEDQDISEEDAGK